MKHIARKGSSLAEARLRVFGVSRSLPLRGCTELTADPPPYSGRVGLAVGFTRPSESVLISDGGLASELEARGHDLSDSLWSARLLSDAPQEIVAVHAAFFRAGAKIATTASYQASFEGFAARQLSQIPHAERLLHREVFQDRGHRRRQGLEMSADECGKLG